MFAFALFGLSVASVAAAVDVVVLLSFQVAFAVYSYFLYFALCSKIAKQKNKNKKQILFLSVVAAAGVVNVYQHWQSNYFNLLDGKRFNVIKN